jgi:hypothetical protein
MFRHRQHRQHRSTRSTNDLCLSVLICGAASQAFGISGRTVMHAGIAGPQRRELATLGAAAIASSVFFLLPLVLAQKPSSSAIEVADAASSRLDSVPVEAPRDLAVVPAMSPDPTPHGGSRPAARARAVRRVKVEPAIPARAARPGNRVVRLFLGDGSHTVQPFPVPADPGTR